MPSKVDITAAITGKMGWKIAHTIAGSPGQSTVQSILICTDGTRSNVRF